MKLHVTLPEGSRRVEPCDAECGGWVVYDKDRDELVGDESGQLVFGSLRRALRAARDGEFTLLADDYPLDPDTLTPAGARGEVIP